MFLPLLLLWSVAAPLHGEQTDLVTVLQRAGAYVTQFYEELSGVVTEEDCTQEWTRTTTAMVTRGQVIHRQENVGKRRLRSARRRMATSVTSR